MTIVNGKLRCRCTIRTSGALAIWSTTPTAKFPPAAIREGATVAVNCVELTNVVGKLLPLRVTVLPESKAVPVTCSVNAAEPSATVVGEMEVMVAGANFFV